MRVYIDGFRHRRRTISGVSRRGETLSQTARNSQTSCAMQETSDVARETRAIECKDVPVSTIIGDQRVHGRWAITEFNRVTFENGHLFLFAQSLHHRRIRGATKIAKTADDSTSRLSLRCKFDRVQRDSDYVAARNITVGRKKK